MNQIEKNKLKTDQAWEQLYTRLEQDGLLDKPISGTQIPYRIGLMKWAAAIVTLCIGSYGYFPWTRTDTGNHSAHPA